MGFQVHILKATGFDPAGFADITASLGLAHKLARATVIGIKANLAAGNHCEADSGVLVGQALLETLIQALRRMNPTAEIRIMEADSTAGGYAYLKFEHQGLPGLAARHPGVTLCDLSRGRLRSLSPNGQYFSTVELAESLFECDFMISLAKIKTHNMTTVTGATKNLFGCLPVSDKSVYHTSIDKVVADMAALIPVDLCVLDGNPGMEGNGPVNGEAVPLNRMLFGNNPVATDSVMAAMLGVDPRRVGHLRLAEQAGIGSTDLAAIRILGAGLDEAAVRIRQNSPLQRSIIRGGIGIQRLGEALARFGHQVHYQKSPAGVAKVILKSVLLLFVTPQRLTAGKKAVACAINSIRR
ncbi:MAG TPA: DUF362 domain-containing protein [Humidesulfovibrio sp.]|uniref:DUF362 domain-containing protein n=1 Tax=Humidesulfovibrio sp. TaxID=2910988 RepID=UPI002BE865A0|nr:DUF362 domain-containing protein [Humidesulfovibrio sp.]HWR04514.1 DUF362 domain-containing protein [Humidesulfovibrio sp.]